MYAKWLPSWNKTIIIIIIIIIINITLESILSSLL